MPESNIQNNINTPAFTEQELTNNYWECVQKIVETYGDKDFIVTTKGTLSYYEAGQQAGMVHAVLNSQTYHLRKCGIGLFLSDPLEIIPAMIGTLRSGNYIIPLDPGFPETTLIAMVRIAEIKAILTSPRYYDRVHAILGRKIPIIAIDVPSHTDVNDLPPERYSLDDIAQILFTSGSTGEPKGAIEDYRYLLRAVANHVQRPYYLPEDRHLQLSTFTFSGPHIRLFTALVSGSTLFYYNLKEDGMAGLPQWIRKHQITFYSSTPTVFRKFVSRLDSDDTFPSVVSFSGGGEKKLHSDLEAVRRHFPNVRSIRLGYGSTETQNVTSNHYPIDHDFGQQELPSGRPARGQSVFIWDENGNTLQVGEEGEIIVYGDALARGYMNNPELTRKHFIVDTANPGYQYFRSGDLGKVLPDGQLVHLGRIDNMVKIKGVRIEIDTIENVVLSYPGVTQVASKAIEKTLGEKRLATYFVPEDGINIPISDLRKYLADRLPRHLLPHYLLQLPELPIIPGRGKIDINRLPNPNMIRPDLINPYIPPSTDLEKKLLKIWEDEIGITGIGVTDDFFDVGGDSLIGVLIFVHIEKELGRSLPVSTLLTASTIRSQAEIIGNRSSTDDFSPLITIRSHGKKAPLFFIPGKGGYPTRIRHLARLLDDETPVYALQDLMKRNTTRALHQIESVATFYLNELRKVSPHGPYILVGESMGGKVALEVAQQLRAQGEMVSILAMLDTYFMDYQARLRSLEYVWMIIKKHSQILLQANWQGRVEYFRFYRETLFEKLKRRFNKLRRKVQETVAIPLASKTIEDNNKEAANKYQPHPYPDRVILFKAMRGPHTEETANGWDKVELGQLAIHPVDCYHGSILFEPAVSELAKVLNDYIKQYNSHK